MSFDIKNYLNDLEDIVNIDSWSFDPAGVEKAIDELYGKFVKDNLNVKKLSFGYNVGPCLEITNVKDKNYDGPYDVMLLGHIDTVFKQGTCAERPFKIEGNMAKGPGTADMKAGLILGYYLMKDITDAKICMAVDSDEEISSDVCHEWMINLALKSKCVIVLEPGEPDDKFVINRKGIAEYQIDFAGKSAHAGDEPEKGINSIVEMANWVIKLDNFNNNKKGTTVNAGVVRGGTVSNVVPEHSSIRVDVRFKDSDEIQRLENAMNNMVKEPFVKGIETNIKRLDFMPTMQTNKNTEKLCKLAEKIAKNHNINIEWEYCGGVSDGNITAGAGVPTLDSMGPVGYHCHNENEYIDIDSVQKRFEFLKELIESV